MRAVAEAPGLGDELGDGHVDERRGRPLASARARTPRRPRERALTGDRLGRPGAAGSTSQMTRSAADARGGDVVAGLDAVERVALLLAGDGEHDESAPFDRRDT